MAVLGFVPGASNLANNYDAVANKISTGKQKPSLQMASQAKSTYLPADKFYRRLAVTDADKATTRYLFNPTSGDSLARDATWCDVPDGSSELWLRVFNAHHNSSTTAYTYNNYITRKLAEFWNWDGTRMKLVADILPPASGGDGYVYYRVYAETEGVDTVAYTHPLGVFPTAYTAYDSSTKESVFDIRINLDLASGFVQVYDYTVTRVAESLGVTCNNLKITHASILPSKLSPYNACPLFSILANEPTFGMFVMPLYAKAEGTYQQQGSGDYTKLALNYYPYTQTGAPTLTKEGTDQVKYSYTPQSATDVALPANHSILLLEYRTAIDTTKSDAGDLPVNALLRFKDTGNEYSYLMKPPKSNVSSTVTVTPDVSSVRWDKNPITGASWDVNDLGNIELGFSI